MSIRADDERPAVVAFSDRVAAAVELKRSQLVVGLDPRIDLLPVELRGEAVGGREAAAAAVERFCKGIIDAVAPYVVAVKPQVAFFEALGSDGWRALESVSRYAAGVGLLVIADAKRGDIGSTARAYAAAFLEPRGAEPPLADALTVNPYLGTDSMDPFLSACRTTGRGSSSSCGRRTPAAATSRTPFSPTARRCGGSRRPRRRVGRRSDRRARDVERRCRRRRDRPRVIGDARRTMPQAIILLPGVGAQGATPADVARAFTSGPASALVNASRSVIYAYRDGEDDWRAAAGHEAARLTAETGALGRCGAPAGYALIYIPA